MKCNLLYLLGASSMNAFTKMLIAASLVASTLCACSINQSGWLGKGDPFTELASFTAGAAGNWSMEPPSVTGVLPNTTYTLYGEGDKVIVSAPLSDLVVTGRFTSSKVYSSTIWNEDDSSQQVEASDPADTRVLHLDFTTDEIIAVGEDVDSPDEITVSLTIMGDQDADAVGQGLIDSGNVVLFLEEPYDLSKDEGWTVSLAGAMIGQLSPNGEITFPILSNLEKSSASCSFELVEDSTTLSILKKVAAQPEVEVTL
jgi:hypothetical protein